jgi:hypothetical protein
VTDGVRRTRRGRCRAISTSCALGCARRRNPGVARPDLPLWLSRMERLLQPGLDEDLAIRARYELAVATLIGQRDLRPADHHVAALFADVAKWDHPFRLQDAQVLLTFLYGMVGAGRSGLRPAQLAQWHEALRARLDELVAEESLPTRRAYRDSRLVWRARIGSRMSTVAERLSLSPTESGRGVGRRVARLRRSNQGGGKDPRSDLFGNHWYHSLQPSRVRARYATAGTKEASGARGKLSTATHDLLATFVPQRAATFR